MVKYIYDSNKLIIGLECEAPRHNDLKTFYSIAEYIGIVQTSIHQL